MLFCFSFYLTPLYAVSLKNDRFLFTNNAYVNTEFN